MSYDIDMKNDIKEDKSKSSRGFIKDFYTAKDKKMLLLNIEESDKRKLVELDSFVLKALEYSVLERSTKLTPSRGEVWTVDLGVNVGDEMDKVRPCIVVSYDEYNNKSNLATVVPITHSDCNYGTQFEISDGLFKYFKYEDTSINGIAKAEQITTKSKARFGKCLGKLNEHGMKELNKIVINHAVEHNSLLELLPELFSLDELDTLVKRMKVN